MRWSDRKPHGCVRCGGPVTAEAKPWLEMVGYARPVGMKTKGAGSSLAFRFPTGRAICGSCAIDELYGKPQGQKELF